MNFKIHLPYNTPKCIAFEMILCWIYLYELPNSEQQNCVTDVTQKIDSSGPVKLILRPSYLNRVKSCHLHIQYIRWNHSSHFYECFSCTSLSRASNICHSINRKTKLLIQYKFIVWTKTTIANMRFLVRGHFHLTFSKSNQIP